MTDISNQVPLSEILASNESRYEGIPSEMKDLIDAHYMPVFPDKFKDADKRSYSEDFALENGNYMNTCIECKNKFFGHKRRVMCKVCFEKESPKPVINEKAEFAVQMLRKYAHQTGNLLRGTSDLSPLEEWLIIQLYEAQKERREEKTKPYTACSNIGKNIISPIDKI